ncbi:MAG: DUF4115 domain-containing protein [Spirochaetes bacterium]|nr:DUF4115 domain-containing protein [Spirochaetota bacterium]
MTSIGEKLISARESRKLSRKDVSKETNIPLKYIEALEEEEFDRLPSETHVIGFLRSYSEFLRINADEIIQLYKGYKIGESATPLEELTKPTRSPVFANIILFFDRYRNYFLIGIAAVGFFLVILFINMIFSSRVDVGEGDDLGVIKNQEHDKKTTLGNYHKLVLQNDAGNAIVSVNEGVFFTVEKREAMFILRSIQKGESAVIEISPGNTVETLVMNQPKVVTIKGCPREVEFTLKALAENTANIKVQLGKQVEIAEEGKHEEQKAEVAVHGSSIIARDERSLSMIIEMQFVQKSFVEVYLDGMMKRRGMVPAGVSERFEANSHAQIRIGNAGGVKVKINNVEYNWGGPGQVANKVITWRKDPSKPNLWHIVVKDW